MELKSPQQRDMLLHTLTQIQTAIIDLQNWNNSIGSQKDLLNSSEGMQRLAGNCMYIQVIGEGFKKIDKISDGQLLILRPEIPWKQVMSMRDRISHGYFDLDIEYIDDIIQNDLTPILNATKALTDIVKAVHL